MTVLKIASFLIRVIVRAHSKVLYHILTPHDDVQLMILSLGAEECGTITPAHIISTSYSYNEADLTPFYTARQCAEYAKVGA